MQGSKTWAPPAGTLGRIVGEAAIRVVELQGRRPSLEKAAESAGSAPGFSQALRSPRVAVIAEVKRRSPSKGWIGEGISAPNQAEQYQRGGAAAVSVLTEPAHFHGSSDDLVAVRQVVAIPALKKDFHIDPIQLIEAKSLGASAALLIVRALSPNALVTMMRTARDLSLEVLVEVRDRAELDRALDAGATIVGINNRDLETLVITKGTAEALMPSIPLDILVVAESGVEGVDDVKRAARSGADAVLVGSVLSASANPEDAVRALAAVPRETGSRPRSRP